MNNKIIGLIAFLVTAIGVLAWVFTDGSIPGGFLNFISGPSFILVVGMGGGMAYMRKHTLNGNEFGKALKDCLLYTSPSPRDRSLSRMPSSA